MSDKPKKIFVDLDGTLIRTDLFVEAILQFLKNNPLNIFPVILWLFKGIPYAKERIAHEVSLKAEALPYETSLLEYLKQQKANGRQLVLATASHRIYADKVAAHLEIFDSVLATDADHNLKGANKLAAIRDAAGDETFAYAGDSTADSPIWAASASGIFVNAPKSDVATAQSAGTAEKIIKSRPPLWRAFLKSMRPHQYAKNALIFAPIFTSQQHLPFSSVLASLLAFICFSLCASGVYFLNDLVDLAADRQHTSKRHRPLPSGDLSLHAGVVGAIALPLIAFALTLAFLPPVFAVVLIAYLIITMAYSFWLKQIATADVMVLASLYTLRVIAGSAATGIVLSSWFLAFSMFVFVSLGYLKRYIEVAAAPEEDGNVHGRDYSYTDSETMFSLGVANITAAVVILALYINSPEVKEIYRTPEILWLLCLLLLYWGNRIWVGARRGRVADDPVLFALRDKISLMVGGAFVLVTLAAKYLTL
ncbi:UbiA family prenyltransferase [Ruegeria arenilitoris]|uniref:UbiA family prenyltransferase n=1 Tax=Ruegeria arenilitoris TaxID=1173585 RepID=UPI00147AB847|nr:UbiA family prenyltransferase [Ruegeria arenilitoris]